MSEGAQFWFSQCVALVVGSNLCKMGLYEEHPVLQAVYLVGGMAVFAVILISVAVTVWIHAAQRRERKRSRA